MIQPQAKDGTHMTWEYKLPVILFLLYGREIEGTVEADTRVDARAAVKRKFEGHRYRLERFPAKGYLEPALVVRIVDKPEESSDGEPDVEATEGRVLRPEPGQTPAGTRRRRFRPYRAPVRPDAALDETAPPRERGAVGAAAAAVIRRLTKPWR